MTNLKEKEIISLIVRITLLSVLFLGYGCTVYISEP
jgi:hypothetical protein